MGGNQSFGYAYSVGIYSHYACLASTFGLYIIDIFDPTHSRQIGFHSLPEIGNFTINGVTATAAATKDNYLYLAAGPGRSLIFDLSNPANSVESGFYVTNSIEDDIVLSNNYLFVTYDYEMNDTLNGDGYISENNLLTNVIDNGNGTGIPHNFYLFQNYPNPFNPSTIITYQIPQQSKVVLKAYDMLGSDISPLVDKVQNPAKHEVKFNAVGLLSGVYLYRLMSGNFLLTKKLVLLK